MIRALAAVVGVLALAGAATAQTEPVRVYVFTAVDPGGFTDQDQQQRVDSVADVKKALAKAHGLALVDAADQADVSLEVLGRGKAPTGAVVANGGRGWMQAQELDRTVVALRLTAGTYATTLEGHTRPGRTYGAWGEAGRNAAKAAAKWIDQNRATLAAHPHP